MSDEAIKVDLSDAQRKAVDREGYGRYLDGNTLVATVEKLQKIRKYVYSVWRDWRLRNKNVAQSYRCIYEKIDERLEVDEGE